MDLASLIEQYRPALEARYGERLLPGHYRALDAILNCRTVEAGEIQWHCADCALSLTTPRSCGHRSCPRCQHHEASQWLDRQRAKLLPVEYFMVTFTLPYELRPVAWHHQRLMYDLLLKTSTGVMKDFGLNPQHLGAELGMTAVLHTHSRRLDFHPHCHIIVPGGGVDKPRKQWRKLKGRYLFNGKALAKVFRARLLEAMSRAGLPIPARTPKKWVAQCVRVGSGEPALKYLSRYLYRGALSDSNIIANQEGEVTFRYVESGSGETRTRTLKGEDFLWLLLQHVLPKGFRRVRDYGFLQGNAKKLLTLVQRILCVVIHFAPSTSRPAFPCPRCRQPMRATGFLKPKGSPG